jgi:hypothetical protein
MSDPNGIDDLPLRDTFAQFRADFRTEVPAPDIAAVHGIARRRHRTRIALAGVAAIVAVAVPVATYAAVNGNTALPEPPGISTGPSEPSSTPSESAPPTESSIGGSPTRQAPDGRISKEILTHSTLDLPAWAPGAMGGKCPTGKVTLKGNYTQVKDDGLRVGINRVINVDVDHDGAEETVAEVDCLYQTGDSQVVAFDRDSSGKIITIGQVIGVSPDTPIKEVMGLRAEPDGRVGVLVGDLTQGSDPDIRLVEQQWRSYGLQEERFRQTDGQTGFHPTMKAVELSLTTSELVLGPASGGVRRGTLTVTVTHKGTRAAAGLWLEVQLTNDAVLPTKVQLGTAPQGCKTEAETDPGLDPSMTCHLAGPAAGAAKSYVFTFSSPVANDAKIRGNLPSFAPSYVNVFAGEEQPGIRLLTGPDGSAGAYMTTPVRIEG